MGEATIKTEVLVTLETVSLVKVFILATAVFMMFFLIKKQVK